jgi:ABC-2 type transport system permease protein
MSLAQGATSHGLWPTAWKLIRLRLLISVNGFRRAKRGRKVGTIVLVVALGVLMYFAFTVTGAFLSFMRSPELTKIIPDATSFINSLPVMVLGGAFLGILLTSFGVLLQALYLAGDMDFLLSAPIPMRAVFLTKLLQAILPNFGLSCLVALPLLFGLGSVAGYQAVYYPLVVITMAALALAAAGVSSLLVMFIVRLFPARRVAEILGFLGALVSILCSQSGQLVNFSEVSSNQALVAARLVSRFDTPWSPLAWAGRGLVRMGEGDWLSGVGLLALTLGLSAVAFGVALVSSERLYYSGWANLSGRRKRKEARRPARAPARKSVWALAGRSLPSPIRAIITKDFAVLRRDLRNMSQMITPIVLGIIYSVMLIRGGGEPPAGQGQAPQWFMTSLRSLLAYGNIGIALFVGWMLLARLAAMGFSHEGKYYWLLKSAPVRSAHLLSAKFAVAYLPALALGWAFLLILTFAQHASLVIAIFTFLVVALCLASVTGVNLAFGVTGAVFNWEDPRQMLRGSSGCLSSLSSAACLPMCLLFFAGPVFGATLLGLPEIVGQIAGLVLGGAVCLACALVPLLLVRKRVPVLGET